MNTIVENPYRHIGAVAQWHRNHCWAACLEWWAKAVNNNNSITQQSLRNESGVRACYEHNSATDTALTDTGTNEYGQMEAWELLWLIRQPRWGMQVEQLSKPSSKKLRKRLKNGPVFLGYYDAGRNTWHVNVICNYDSALKMVVSMEPVTGQFEDRSYSEYVDHSPYNIIGYKAN